MMYSFCNSGYLNFQSWTLRSNLFLYSWSRAFCSQLCHLSKINQTLWYPHCIRFQRSWTFKKDLKYLRFFYRYSCLINDRCIKTSYVEIPIKECCRNWSLIGRLCCMSTCWIVNQIKITKNCWLCGNRCRVRNSNLSLTIHESSSQLNAKTFRVFRVCHKMEVSNLHKYSINAHQLKNL